MARLGIIGNGSDKFTPEQTQKVKDAIRALILSARPPVTVVSGHSPVGGVDIWAEELAVELGVLTDIKAPKQHSWGAVWRHPSVETDATTLHFLDNRGIANKWPRGTLKDPRRQWFPSGPAPGEATAQASLQGPEP